jgi:hypothetical protein
MKLGYFTGDWGCAPSPSVNKATGRRNARHSSLPSNRSIRASRKPLRIRRAGRKFRRYFSLFFAPYLLTAAILTSNLVFPASSSNCPFSKSQSSLIENISPVSISRRMGDVPHYFRIKPLRRFQTQIHLSRRKARTRNEMPNSYFDIRELHDEFTTNSTICLSIKLVESKQCSDWWC